MQNMQNVFGIFHVSLAQLLLSSQVKVSQGRAKGVTLRNGAEILAPLVVSAAGAEATAKLLPQFAPAQRLEGGISHMSPGMAWDWHSGIPSGVIKNGNRKGTIDRRFSYSPPFTRDFPLPCLMTRG